jgi:hypothetical protein
MRMKLAGLMVALLATAVSAQQPNRSQPARQAQAPARAAQPPRNTTPALPPLVYVCPMPGDEDVLEDKPGNCPKCNMKLEAIRLDSKFWCPTHQTLEVHDGPGKCRRDGLDLVQVTLSETWTCSDKPDEKLLEPKRCADGTQAKINYALRAHGDHNPKHGGMFFMAENGWNHLEGTYPAAGQFRVHFYDNFSKPMSPRGFTGSVVILDKDYKELASYPLAVEANNRTMLARIPAPHAALPINAAVKIRFKAGEKENFFNFPFSKYTVEPVTPPAAAPARPAPATTAAPRPAAPQATASRAPAAAPAPAAAAPQSAPGAMPNMPMPAAGAAPAASQDAAAQAPLILDSPLNMPPGLAEATDETRLPKDVKGLVAELETRAGEVGKLVQEGELAQVWLPAMGTKTVALALDSHVASLPERQRAAATAAVKQIVMASWDIDNYGDLGNGLKITEAYKRLEAAVQSLKAAYAQ